MISDAFRRHIVKEMDKIKKSSFLFFVFEEKKHIFGEQQLLEYLVKYKRMRGIYISLRSTYKETEEMLEANDIDREKLFIIVKGRGKNKHKNSYYLKNAESLAEISVALNDVTSTGKFRFMLFDSYESILTFAGPILARKFIEYLVHDMKAKDMTSVIVSVEGDASSRLMPYIFNIPDKVLFLG